MKIKENMKEALNFIHPDFGDFESGNVELSVTGCNGATRFLWKGFCGRKDGLVSGWFSDRRRLVLIARDIERGWRSRDGFGVYAGGIYVTLNPVNEVLLGWANNILRAGVKRTQDKYVSVYRNIFLDVNAGCPTDVSSSDPEHVSAINLAKKIRAWLRENMFWPEPMLVDSGNGAHLVYKAHFESTPENVDLLNDFIKTAGEFFDSMSDNGMAHVDTTVCNPARLIKLPGTTTRKGDSTDNRPHRISRVLECPEKEEELPAITSEILRQTIKYMKQLLGVPVEARPVTQSNNTGNFERLSNDEMFNSMSGVEPLRRGSTLKVDKYLRDHGIRIKEIKPRQGDSRLYELERCVFDSTHTGGESAIGQSEDGTLWYQCFHETCKSDRRRRWPQARQIISGDKGLEPWMEGGRIGIEFPHVNAQGKPYARVENFKALLEAYGILLRYNIMSRKNEYKLPKGLWKDADRLNNLSNAFFKEICARHALPFGRLDDFILLTSEENTYHPAREWIESAEWDGTLHMEELAKTVTVPIDQQKQWRIYLRKWLVQGIAALYDPQFSGRGVLTFTGVQGVGKKGWFRKLTPPELNAFGEGLYLDPAGKDSRMEVLSRWIVKLGGLDVTFRKADIARLKAFITKKEDDVRPTYGRSVETWRRQTVFGATVNDPEFFVDATGNTLWWVIETLEIDWNHDVNMQQIWAEAKLLYDLGDPWLLNDEETEELNRINSAHEVVDPIEEDILKYFKFDTLKTLWNNPMTSTDILKYIGIKNISRALATKAGILLKKLVGKSQQMRVNGVHGRFYMMPEKRTVFEDIEEGGPDDILTLKKKTKEKEVE